MYYVRISLILYRIYYFKLLQRKFQTKCTTYYIVCDFGCSTWIFMEIFCKLSGWNQFVHLVLPSLLINFQRFSFPTLNSFPQFTVFCLNQLDRSILKFDFVPDRQKAWIESNLTTFPSSSPPLQVLDRAVLRALHQPIGAEGVDGPKKDEHMIFKYVIVMKMRQHLSIPTKI